MACQQALVSRLRQFSIVIRLGDLGGQQQVGRGLRAKLEGGNQRIPGRRRIAGTIQLGQSPEGLGLGCGIDGFQKRRLLDLLPGFIPFGLVRQQQPQRKPCLELFWVGGDGFAVIGGGRILVAGRILDIAKVEKGAGVAGVLLQVLFQQRARALEIPLLDLAFGRFPVWAGGTAGYLRGRYPARGFPAAAGFAPARPPPAAGPAPPADKGVLELPESHPLKG